MQTCSLWPTARNAIPRAELVFPLPFPVRTTISPTFFFVSRCSILDHHLSATTLLFTPWAYDNSFSARIPGVSARGRLQVEVGLQEERHALQLQGSQAAHFGPTAEDAAVVQHDLAAAQRRFELAAGDRRVTADQAPAADTLPVYEWRAGPEHRLGVVEGVFCIEIEPRMYDDKFVQQDVERQRPQEVAVERRDIAGTVRLEAGEGFQAAVGAPDLPVVRIAARLQEHLLVVAANSGNRQAALAEIENEVQHPIAVR